jgi:hypothetical protein
MSLVNHRGQCYRPFYFVLRRFFRRLQTNIILGIQYDDKVWSEDADGGVEIWDSNSNDPLWSRLTTLVPLYIGIKLVHHLYSFLFFLVFSRKSLRQDADPDQAWCGPGSVMTGTMQDKLWCRQGSCGNGSFWCGPGSVMMRARISHGADTDQSWCGPGSVMVRTMISHDADTDHSGCRHGSCGPGSSMVGSRISHNADPGEWGCGS